MKNHNPNDTIFTVITGAEAETIIPKPTEWIIEKIYPMGFKTILAGTTGSNKSYYAMREGMSIANDEDSFLGFNIMQKGLSVLFVDTEIGQDELLKRYHRIKKNFKNWGKGIDRFNMLSKKGSFSNIWNELKQHVEKYKPDVLYIDCLYNSVTERDISKGHNIAKFTDHITELRESYNITIKIIHHFNKGYHEYGLTIDRMSGASALQNWAEHIMLMTRTNEHELRLIRIVKARGVDFTDNYYGLNWNAEEFKLEMRGVVKNWEKYILNDEKKYLWQQALEKMLNTFTTNDWVDVVVNDLKMVKERQANKWLKEIEFLGMIKKIKHGHWEKTSLGFVEDIIELE
jgi:RecA-family ATPase